MARAAIVPASRGRRVTCFGVIVIGPPSNFGRGYYRDAHFAVLFRAVRLPSAVIESCLPGTVARLADAYGNVGESRWSEPANPPQMPSFLRTSRWAHAFRVASIRSTRTRSRRLRTDSTSRR